METCSGLVGNILVKFDEILSMEAFLVREREDSPGRWRDEFHRFHVWSKNVGIQQVGGLTMDQRLKIKAHLHSQIMRLLRRLQELIEYLKGVLSEEETRVRTIETTSKVVQTLPGLDGSTEMSHIYECFTDTMTWLNRLSYTIPKMAKYHTSMDDASIEVKNTLEEPDLQNHLSPKEKSHSFYTVLAGRVDKPTIFSTWAHVHPRIAGFVGGKCFKSNTLEGARNSMMLQGITDFDESLKHEGENIDKQEPQQAYYAVAFGRKTGIYNTWQEAREEIKDYSFPCYKRFDTIHEAEVFLEDWNHAYADSWRWTIRNRLSNGWLASDLGIDIDSALFKMGFEVQSQHEPKKLNVSQLSGLEKLEEEQKDQTLLPCKGEVFPGDNLRKKPQHIAALAATSELQNTSEDWDGIDRQQNRLQAKCLQEVTVEDMYLVNENENKFAEHSKNLEVLQQKIAKLESTCSLEVAKVSPSAKDISTLQANLKEKDKMIDQMKAAVSKLKSMLSSQQKKNEELETTNASMSTELQVVRARIQKLGDFPIQSSDID